jgi:FMN phosphatase YigB (HAD superfamily)
MFIDDHLPNIEAAQALGLHTILFQDARQCGAGLEHWLGAG